MDSNAPSDIDRYWLKSYAPGMPATIDPDQYHSLLDLFDQSIARYAAKPAYTSFGKKMTYDALERQSLKLASYLQSLGLAKGARIALMMPNCFQYPICIFGALRGGYTVVNVNPLYTPRELEHQLNDSGAEVIVVFDSVAVTLQQVLSKTRIKRVIVTTLGDLLGFPKGQVINFVMRHIKKMVPAWNLPGHVMFNDALATGANLPYAKPAINAEDIAFLQYTGGTTGVSKGAVLLHRNIIANLLQAEAWYQPALRRVPQDQQVRKITALPLYHIFALTVCCLLGMRIGAVNVLITNPRDIKRFLATLRKEPPHVLPAVNTLFNGLLNHANFGRVDWSHLVLAVGGGMSVQEPVAARWLEKTGSPIIEGYGLSETSPCCTANPTDSHEFTHTIGLPLPSTDIVIRDDAGQQMPPGQPGELCIRGPQVMAGYWRRPDDTAETIGADGFLKTGDIGFMDERGYIKIVDRKKDMILVSGFNVYPNEVEDVLAACPGVLESAVVGVKDAQGNELVKAFIVRRDPALDEAGVRKYCHANLTGYKNPKLIEFRDELPKSNVGKILRRVLRDEVKT